MTTPFPTQCPTPDELRAFHTGGLAPADADALAAHLEGCADCEAALDALDDRGDTLLSDLRRGPAAGEEVSELLAGRYRLVQLLGQGGMGAVWRAEQVEPVRRQVAVKLVKAGMDSRAVLRRFAAERQALALMDHPNIARVFDAGSTARGRPFFVMELVEGVPITQYCDARRLTPRERLALFVPVCQAVQHAHQKGVIHRDLKPSNVLVTEVDGRPVPKVIDFGVAKAAGVTLADGTQATGVGMVVGTPEYMAPEQAGGNPADIDTRADVYALGVLLYELLTGTTPITRQRLKQAALLEILRLVREEEPPPPSSRLSTADALPSIAADRNTEPARLSRLMKGDLDWVVLKALEKDRGRRYDSAGGFARDIERHLADEPVEAARPSRGYRLRKFVRRYRRGLTVVVLAAVLLVAAAGVSIWQAVRATQAEATAVAERNEKQTALQAEAAARKQAEAERELAKTINDFLQYDLLGQVTGDARLYARNPNLTVREALDRAAEGVDKRFRDRPRVEAAIRTSIGSAYFEVGEYQKAADHLKVAAETLARLHGDDHEDTLNTLGNLAKAYVELRRPADAVPLMERKRDVYAARYPANHPAMLATLNNLAGVYSKVGRLPDAIRLMEQLRDTRQKYNGPSHPETVRAEANLAVFYLNEGRATDAVPLFEKTHAAQKVNPGPDHPDTIVTLCNLAFAYREASDKPKSLATFEQALPMARKAFTATHPRTISLTEKYVMVLGWTGQYDRAAELMAELVAVHRSQSSASDSPLATALADLGYLLLQAGRPADAEPHLRECLAIRERRRPNHSLTAEARSMLGESLTGQRRYVEAEPLLLAGYDGLRRAPDKQPAYRMGRAADRLVRLYLLWNKPVEMEKWKTERAKLPRERAPLPRQVK